MAGPPSAIASGALDYEQQKRLARSTDAGLRAELAAHPDVRPEILYFLATDTAVKVRRAVADNPRTPAQAHALLAEDGDDAVRETLADRIARLLPDLTEDGRREVGSVTLRALERLAHDRATMVRTVLASTLTDIACAPPKVRRS